MKDELAAYDAVGLGELIHKGEINASELVEVTIQRIEKVNPRLNAVIHTMYDDALRLAKNAYPAKAVDAKSPFPASLSC